MPKTAPADEVVAAARHAASSPSAFTAADLAEAMKRRLAPAGPQLSPRESQVLRLLADGMSVAGIAKQLYVSESTAKTHISKLYEKLGAANRAQALMTALRLGLLEAPDAAEVLTMGRHSADSGASAPTGPPGPDGPARPARAPRGDSAAASRGLCGHAPVPARAPVLLRTTARPPDRPCPGRPGRCPPHGPASATRIMAACNRPVVAPSPRRLGGREFLGKSDSPPWTSVPALGRGPPEESRAGRCPGGTPGRPADPPRDAYAEE